MSKPPVCVDFDALGSPFIVGWIYAAALIKDSTAAMVLSADGWELVATLPTKQMLFRMDRERFAYWLRDNPQDGIEHYTVGRAP